MVQDRENLFPSRGYANRIDVFMNFDREAFDPGDNLTNSVDERRFGTNQHNCWKGHGLDDPQRGDKVRGRTRYEDRRTSVGETLLLVEVGRSIALPRPRMKRGRSARA